MTEQYFKLKDFLGFAVSVEEAANAGKF